MGSFGTNLHRDCNAMGDTAKISPHVPSTLSSRSIAGCKDPRNCADPWNLGKSEWDQKLGKIEFVFSLYDKMRWKWDAVNHSTPGSPEHILRVTHSTSVTPVFPYSHCRPLTIYLEAEIEWTERCTWRPWSIKFGDSLGGRGRVNSDMHFEGVIERVWRCNWRSRLSEVRDTLRGRDWASLDMQLESVIEWTQRCTLRLWPSEFGDALQGYDRARLEEYLEAVGLEGGTTAAETLFIGLLVIARM